MLQKNDNENSKTPLKKHHFMLIRGSLAILNMFYAHFINLKNTTGTKLRSWGGGGIDWLK